MHAAGIAAASGIEMSSHLVPEVSVHLLAATPTAHWLEYVDWADAILEEPLQVAAPSPRLTGPALALPGARRSCVGWRPFEIRRRCRASPTKRQHSSMRFSSPAGS
jgi:hypothetical protein